jgi:hypothetical protein
LDCVLNHPGIVALYGFSGGGYNMRQILKQMTDEQRKRIKLVTVVGVDADAPQSDFESSKFPPGVGGWTTWLIQAATCSFRRSCWSEQPGKSEAARLL